MAEDVRTFSLHAILKLCKTGGVILKPHLSSMIAQLIECLSTLEPQVLSKPLFIVFRLSDISCRQVQHLARTTRFITIISVQKFSYHARH